MLKKEKIINDFKKFRFISNLETNNSQDKLLFRQTKMNYEKNTYENKLFYYQNSQTIRIKTQNKPIISKFYNDNNIIYTAKYEKKKKIYTKIYIQNIQSKKAFLEFNCPFEVSNFFVLNQNEIAFLSSENIKKDTESFKYEIDRINFLENGSGYTFNDISLLYIYDIKSKKLEKISSDSENVENFEIDQENDTIYYLSNEVKDVFTLFNKLYSYNFKTKEKICLYDKGDFEIVYANRLGKDIIALATDQKRFGINENPKFYKLEKGKLKLYCDYEYSTNNAVNSDIRYKSSSGIKKIKNSIYFLSTRNEKSSIFKLENGKIDLFFDNINCVDDYVFLDSNLILLGFNNQNVQELYSFKDNKLENITNFSLKFEKHINHYKIEKLNYNSNGQNITGYVLFPTDFDKEKKYPAILSIHGGPKTVYLDNFIYEKYLLSKAGYFVFFTNPHGSDGKDNEFADIRGRYGEIDYQDLMNFTNKVVEKYKNIDTKRLGIIGGSYGGFMTNYVIGQTDRFKAAVSQRSISNWVSFYSTSDIGYYFATDQNNCKFDLDKLWDKSPLKYVNNVKTPTLIIHSDEDYRCPLEQGVQLFTHLKLNKVKTKLVIYKGENHDLSRTGSIKSRISRLEEILKWFEENLK